MAYQYESLLNWLLWGVILLIIAWVVLSAAGYMQRRAYHLTVAGSATSKNIKPDFLTVDHAARQEAIERGKAFDRALASPPIIETIASATSYSRIVALVLAVASFIAACASALQKIEPLQAAFESWSSWDRLIDLIMRYKLGFAIALIVILAHLVLLLRAIARPHHS